ncbi:MAG: alginate lyase family protein [Tepidisphaeraceae bacterium]
MSKRIRPSKLARPLLSELEPRLLLATPSSPRASTLSWFNSAERSTLIERLDNLASQSSLRTNLQSSVTTFDNNLLSAMRSRTAKFFFDPSQANMASLATYMNAKLSGPAGSISSSDTIIDSRLFKADETSGSATVQLTNDINFETPGTGPSGFLQYLNGLSFWREISEAVWFSGTPTKYMDELRYELADFSDTYRNVSVAPSSWSASDKDGYWFVASQRAEMMTWAYFTALGSSSFTAADNTLFLRELMQHGDYLYTLAQSSLVSSDTDSNRLMALASSLHLLGRAFPEFDNAAAWESLGRQLLFQTMDAQIYDDGSDVEQSPGYTLNVTETLLESYWLDQKNNDLASWDAGRVTKLNKAVESYRQFLSPDGKRPAIGDTYRINSITLFLKAGFILGQTHTAQTTIVGSYGSGQTSFTVANAASCHVGDIINAANKNEVLRVTGVNTGTNTLTVERDIFGTGLRALEDGVILYDIGPKIAAKPRVRDVWLLGQVTTLPFMNMPATPTGALGDRGKAYAMTDSGNYVLRSGSDNLATQIIFDTGPKGGIHGHYDPLNFELWSGGHPLIIDPGPYKYDASSDRTYVQSTRAHNTINVDGLNTGELEGPDNPGIRASYNFAADYAQVTGTHYAYTYLPGGPVITRSIWYNYDDTMLVVDFVEGSRARTYQQSFNIPGDASANPTGVTNGDFKTRYSDGSGNVRVQPLLGGTMVRGGLTFVTSADQTGDYKDDAYRYTVSKTDDFAVFATLIQIYDGLTLPNVSAAVTTSQTPSPGQPVTIQITRNGSVERSVTFQQPTIDRVPSTGPNRARENDVEYDAAGNLHMIYQDADTGYLKYAMRDATTNVWTAASVIDDSNQYLGMPSLKLDNNGRPGVAYFDGLNGDLKYATLTSLYNRWEIQTVDSKKSVGQYPSLAYSKSGNAALISYYTKATGDLKVAEQQSGTTWTITSLDTTGDVGRFTNIILDPNRPDLNGRYVIGYEDTTSSAVKYAFNNGGWKFEKIDPNISILGGYVSLAMFDTGTGTVGQAGANRYQPRLSWYESAPDTSLWYAARSADGSWATQRLDGQGTGKSGLYSKIQINASGKPEVYYFDYKNNKLKKVVNTTGSNWVYSVLSAGGRAVSVSRFNTSTAIAALDDVGGFDVVIA